MYAIAVPPALMALDRAGHLLTLAEQADQPHEILQATLAPGMFGFSEQIAITAGFALRSTLPLAGREVPDLDKVRAGSDLRGVLTFAAAEVSTLTEADFAGAETRTISHIAGFANIEQSGEDYLLRFAHPNMWFHLSMAFAVLRAHGIALGKADFDGLHEYPDTFTFDT